MRVAIISDTHNMIRTELKAYLEGCELILHAGDISKPEILDALKAYAPVYVVRGNNDRQWAEEIPYTRMFELGGINFFMIHKVHERPRDLRSQGVDVVIYGHTHKYDDHEEDGMRFLNPGSCGPRRLDRGRQDRGGENRDSSHPDKDAGQIDAARYADHCLTRSQGYKAK